MVDLGSASREGPSQDASVHLLRFRVAGAQLAIPVRVVEEIVDRGALTTIPGVPPHIRGIVAVRGEAIPLLDLEAFLGLAPSERAEDRSARVLVVRVEPYRVGLLCDVVAGVAAVAPSALEPPRASQPPALRDFAAAELDLGYAVAAVLDLRRLLEAARA